MAYLASASEMLTQEHEMRVLVSGEERASAPAGEEPSPCEAMLDADLAVFRLRYCQRRMARADGSVWVRHYATQARLAVAHLLARVPRRWALAILRHHVSSHVL